jgi:hypothetical protein
MAARPVPEGKLIGVDLLWVGHATPPLRCRGRCTIEEQAASGAAALYLKRRARMTSQPIRR